MQEEFDKIKEEWRRKLELLALNVSFVPFKESVYIAHDDCHYQEDGKYWHFEYVYVKRELWILTRELVEDLHHSMVAAVESAGFLQSKKRNGRYTNGKMSISIRKSFGVSDFIVGYCEGNADETKFKRL